MSNELAKPTMSHLETALMTGNLSALSSEQRLLYVKKLCEDMGLNILSRPFDWITLNNKLTLYATKGCAEQLRHVHKVSITITNREVIEGVYVVTAKAKDVAGREDESTGAVPIGGLKGEQLANAYMKAETKAKRRVTFSLLGLNMLDESEVATIPGASNAIDTQDFTQPKQVSQGSSFVSSNPEAVGGQVIDKRPLSGTVVDDRPPTEKMIKRLFAIGYSNGYTQEQIRSVLMEVADVESTSELNKTTYDAVCAHMEAIEPTSLDS